MSHEDDAAPQAYWTHIGDTRLEAGLPWWTWLRLEDVKLSGRLRIENGPWRTFHGAALLTVLDTHPPGVTLWVDYLYAEMRHRAPRGSVIACP